MYDKIDFSSLKLERCDFCENPRIGKCPFNDTTPIDEFFAHVECSKDERITKCDCFVLRFRKVILFLLRVILILLIVRAWAGVAYIIDMQYLGPDFTLLDGLPIAISAVLAVVAYTLIHWLQNMKEAEKRREELNRLHMQKAVPEKKPAQRRKAGATANPTPKEKGGQPKPRKRGA